MHNSVDQPDGCKYEQRLTIPGWMYWGVAIILCFSGGMVAFDYYLGGRLTSIYNPTTDALTEIKLEWTQGYIKTAEVLRGTGSYPKETIDEHFEFAAWYITALLEGGRNSLGSFRPVKDAFQRRQVETLRIKLLQFRELSEVLLTEAADPAMAPGRDYEKLHQAYKAFIEQADAIETINQSGMRKAFAMFRIVQTVLLGSELLILAVIIITFRFYERRRIRDFQVIQQANQRFQAEIIERQRIEADLSYSAAQLEKNNQELRQARYEVEKRNWLKSGEAELHEVMGGEQDIHGLGNNIITFLCKYLNGFVGSFYIAVNNRELELTASYAFYDQPDYPATIKFGQGLVGQAAITGEPMVIDNGPEDYIKVNSSVGATAPKSIAVLPFLFEGRVKGVIELGALHEFNDLHLGFLRQVVDDIGVAVNLSQARERMATLLEQTRVQAAELQAQQEELRVTNEELQEQTEILRESEERLQLQQEELRVANEELGERTRLLEQQKEAIRNQNIQLEKAKADLQQQAMDLDLASRYKSQFMANMSHELRTPLNSMLILSHLLSDREKSVNLNDKQLEYAKTIHTSGQDLLRLINEILDLSKVEAGKLKLNVAPMALDELADNCAGLFHEVARKKGLEFTVEVGADLPETIVTDAHRLAQVVNNFLSNAFKFTDQGSVRLHIRRPETGVCINREDLDLDRCVAMVVSDTGIGVAKEKQQAIFEAFEQADGTTSRKYGGTGLGLSISRELARLLGGEIQMHSEEGRGTVFSLYIPEHLQLPAKPAGEAVPAPAVKVEHPPAEPKATPQSPEREPEVDDDRHLVGPGDKSLLIIEDDRNFAELLVTLGREQGYCCLVAESGEAGLRSAAYYRPSAIVLDIGLPGIDGWQVMERLKSNPETRHVPVHFISAHDNAIEALRMGAIGYLTKPAEIGELRAAFGKIENAVSRPVKRLLVVEDDAALRSGIVELIGNGDVVTSAVESGSEALRLLESEAFDCMILDLGLRDMSGFDLLARLRENGLVNLPVIIYTGKDLSRDEETHLQQYTDSIIVKGVKSPERLLEETTLFLHRVEASLPEDKQRLLRMVHDREATLVDKLVMVVDDDMRNVYALTSLLEEKGMKVVAARNGRECLEQLAARARVDLVLMDIMMPEMDGYETMQAIRKDEKFSRLPIIALTAKAMKGDKGKCIAAGASDYLAKPVDTDKLFSLLRVWLYR